MLAVLPPAVTEDHVVAASGDPTVTVPESVLAVKLEIVTAAVGGWKDSVGAAVNPVPPTPTTTDSTESPAMCA
jgi:hypothetical protein